MAGSRLAVGRHARPAWLAVGMGELVHAWLAVDDVGGPQRQGRGNARHAGRSGRSRALLFLLGRNGRSDGAAVHPATAVAAAV